MLFSEQPKKAVYILQHIHWRCLPYPVPYLTWNQKITYFHCTFGRNMVCLIIKKKIEHIWAGPRICLPPHYLSAWRCAPPGQLERWWGSLASPMPNTYSNGNTKKTFCQILLFKGIVSFSIPGPLSQGSTFQFLGTQSRRRSAYIYATGPFS